jgi:IS30 family transposase
MKKYKQLTREQRSQIFALLQRKTAKKIIAEIIGCSLSTIYREIKRNSTPKGNYLWDKAHEKAIARRKRSSANSKLLYISYSLIYGYSYLRLALI